MKVAVLGAGVSGLSAARLLYDAGCDVTVYEKRALLEDWLAAGSKMACFMIHMVSIFLIPSIQK